MLLALVLAALGVAAIVGSEVIARRYARRYVIGRILIAAPQVSLEQAIDIAARGDRRYVRLHGRISSAEEFPDENDRPLVYRRKRIEIRTDQGRWEAVAEEAEGVPFGVESRGASVAVDSAALGEGLVVLPRESVGRVADLPPGIDAGDAPATAQARLVVEQVSAVEHAFVAGMPQSGTGGEVIISSAARRPLILTTLELPAAMRVLAAGQRGMTLLLGALLIVGVVLLAAAVAVSVFTLA
ncbi:MAG: hypothetical protein M3N29_10365 [Chloroflexota bacterium]|nr:hypothetical protein [Chloroflexota bacterium]